jgi:AcrR family transcriptional regulator
MSSYVAAEMVETPWGTMEELRSRRLRPGPGATRDEVVRNQRERLFGAMISSAATKGYRATTVADLISLAGISRSSFYELFSDKDDCFTVTIRELMDAGLGLLREQLEGPGNPKERGERALRSLLRLIAGQPAAARVALVDAYSAGVAGLEPINQAFEDACCLAHDALRMLPRKEQTPEELSRAIIGGLHRVIYVHLYRGEEVELVEKSAGLWRWVSGYDPPDEQSGRRRPRRPVVHRDFMGRDPHEQIIRSFARAVASRGFAKVTVPQIASEAEISNATFYQHFENKDDAFLAALDLTGAQLLAASLPAARRERHWPAALHRALEGLCGFLVSEPAFAKLRTVEVYTAGPEALAHRDQAWEVIVGELIPAEIREGTELDQIAIDASSGGVYALLYEKVRKDEIVKLHELVPMLSYLMLAPLIGRDEAMAVATGRPKEVAVVP